MRFPASLEQHGHNGKVPQSISQIKRLVIHTLGISKFSICVDMMKQMGNAIKYEGEKVGKK
jgi:hypothetical protein